MCVRLRAGRAEHAERQPVGLRCLSGAEAAEGRFLWLHFSLTNAAAERWLKQYLDLPLAFYESLQENPSTRVEDRVSCLVRD